MRTAATNLVALLVALVGLSIGTGAAGAHAALASSSPADGATVEAVPATVELTFNEAITPEFFTLTIVGPDGQQYGRGETTVSGQTMTRPMASAPPAGRYTVGFRVVSDDGHPIAGQYSFTVTAQPSAASSAPAPAGTASAPPTTQVALADKQSSTGGNDFPAWVFAPVAIVVIAVAAGVVAVVSRRRKT